MKYSLAMTGMILTALLVSCSSQGKSLGSEHAASPASGVTMRFSKLQDEGGESVRIGIVIRNPQRLPIQSVRSWVQFPSDALLVEDLSLDDERFSLLAPGEHTVDDDGGFVMIGRATPRPVTDAEVRIASFRVRKKGQEEAMLSFYDWQPGGNGHTAVLAVTDGVASNILELPSSFSLP